MQSIIHKDLKCKEDAVYYAVRSLTFLFQMITHGSKLLEMR